jgi:hypothetical protein
LTVCLALAGNLWAAPYIDAGSPGGLHFKRVGSTIEISFNIKEAKITDTSGGNEDPLIGQYQNIYTTNEKYDYTLGKEIAPGIWTTSGETASVMIQSKSTGGDTYLSGSTVAQTIDFNTGAITWSTVMSLVTSHVETLGSAALREFSQYGTGQLVFSFATSDELRALVSGALQTGQHFHFLRQQTGRHLGRSRAFPAVAVLTGLLLCGMVLVGFNRKQSRPLGLSGPVSL